MPAMKFCQGVLNARATKKEGFSSAPYLNFLRFSETRSNDCLMNFILLSTKALVPFSTPCSIVVVGKTAQKHTTTTHSLKNLPKPRISLEVVVVVHKRTEKSPQVQPPDQLLNSKNLTRTDFREYYGQPFVRVK